MRHFIIILCLIFSSGAFSHVQKYTLENGLNIVVKEDHRAPIAVSMVWYNVGSADEPGEIFGVSHVLEHYLFKGTPAYPHGVFARTITALGGEFNAVTNNDYTAFYEKIANKHLETSLKLEADRMKNLLWNEEEFNKEIKVIQEERRLRIDDNPQAVALERFLATAHLSSPYQHPVIGWMYNLRQMKMRDAKEWYQRYYTPNNATLVVVGDVTADSVFALAKQYFGPLNKHPLPLRKPQAEPPTIGKKSVQIHSSAQLPVLIMGYLVPSVKTAPSQNATDPYTLEIIAGILGAEGSGRFSKNLEHTQQIASATAVYYNLYARYQTQFVLFGIPSQGHTLNDLQIAMQTEIKRLQTEKISSQELQQIKTQIVAQKTFEKDTLFNQAMEIGLLETTGLGFAVSEQYVARIKAVTAEQIQNVARRYFQENNLTEAQLIAHQGP